MSGSYAFFLHIVAVGMISAVVVGGWVLERRLQKEPDRLLKQHTGTLIRSIGLVSPFAAVLLLLTGIANIFNVYWGTDRAWYNQPWLVTKLVLFAILVVNGSLLGPVLNKRRMEMFRAAGADPSDEPDVPGLTFLNKQISWYYLVQSLLLLAIIYLSTFGTSKHPGYS